jgi:hypothetical protein
MIATDHFADIVDIYLVDHCGIFNDPDRREKLIARL